MKRLSFGAVALLVLASSASAADSVDAPRPIPLTRPEMKELLEDMKQRTPRIPLPELTAEEREKLGEREASYESRLRALYLPFGDGRFRSPRPTETASAAPAGRNAPQPRDRNYRGRDNDPAMTLDYAFKVELFWIASRTNNCQYCLGHQESKLLRAGLTEDQIAALDGDWKVHTPAQQAAYAFARQLTLEPHTLSDSDIDALRKHYTDLQILEMTLSLAGNNSINRWKEGVGVPQSEGGGSSGLAPDAQPGERHTYLTPTSAQFEKAVSQVAPVAYDNGQPTGATVFTRPPLESWDEVQKQLQKAKTRTPRLPLVDEEKAREVLADDAPSGKLPQWARLLANFPSSGKRQVATIRSADEKGDLSPLLKAQAAWIIARQDRAWYALGQAYARLKALGQNDDQIAALDGDWKAFKPRERSLFTLAQKLAASPVVLTDEEVATAVKEAGPRDVVQMVHYTTTRASFNRITETAGLQVEQ